MSTFESSVKQIAHSQEAVYNTLSDLRNLQALVDRAEQVMPYLPEEAKKHAEHLKGLKFDQDSLSIEAPMVGEIKMRIVDREAPKNIKFGSENSPVQFNLWIQLLPTGDNSCKMKLTIKADIPFMLKGMVKKPLAEGIEKVADALAMIPYQD